MAPFYFNFVKTMIESPPRIKHQTGLLQEYHLPVYLVYGEHKPSAHMILSSHELNHGRVVHGLVGLRFAATTSPTMVPPSALASRKLAATALTLNT